jgi:penicillin-binding protein 1A
VWSDGGVFRSDEWIFRLRPADQGLPVRVLDGPGPRPFSRAARVAQVYRVCLEGGDVVRLAGDHWATGAVVVIENDTGAVRALSSGRGMPLGGFNRATRALRQPGSTFKPFVYAAALASGHVSTEQIADGRVAMMRDDLSRSRNAPALRLARRVGHPAVITTAYKMGIATPLDDHWTLPLGTREVTPLEMAVAYSTIARGGLAMDPVFVESVTDWRGAPVALPARPPSRRAIPVAAAADLTGMLREVFRTGTAKRARREGADWAGKTGTTDGPMDAWFVGFTSTHTIAVWIGTDLRVGLGADESGASAALPAWVAIAAGLAAE